MSARFLRQTMLAEIGATGQARIEASAAPVGGAGLAHEVAAAYATRGGFAEVTPGEISIDALAPEDIVRREAPRQVLAGARAALAAFRAAIFTNEEAPLSP